MTRACRISNAIDVGVSSQRANSSSGGCVVAMYEWSLQKLRVEAARLRMGVCTWNEGVRVVATAASYNGGHGAALKGVSLDD